jgi:hypothetical protein
LEGRELQSTLYFLKTQSSSEKSRTTTILKLKRCHKISKTLTQQEELERSELTKMFISQWSTVPRARRFNQFVVRRLKELKLLILETGIVNWSTYLLLTQAQQYLLWHPSDTCLLLKFEYMF